MFYACDDFDEDLQECEEIDPCDCPIRTDACQENPNPGDSTEIDYYTITLLPEEEYQVIHDFGASDAWSIQFVGKNWPEIKREQIAELLFSTGFDENENPKGIGLSSWRFNIGGGSAEQGWDSDIQDEWRRAESFINNNEEYDWSKQSGQQWFLKKAAEYGVHNFTGFVNSPPVAYTKNGKAYSENGGSANISSESYPKYAAFLTTVLKNVESLNGITFKYVSPFNEPQWAWRCCGQEGSPWNNDEIATFTRVLDSSISAEGLTTQIEITEAGQLDYLYADQEDGRRSDQINNFFNSERDTYIGDLSNVAPKIAGHSYFTTYGLGTLLGARKSVRNRIQEIDPSLEFAMTEYTILENNDEINGNGRDLGMTPAIYMARVIHADLVYANATTWQWWLAVSPYDYKDGLVYIDFNKNDGSVYESKMLWALGNFSRFIRPGMKRIGIERSDNLNDGQAIQGMLQSAFKSSNEIVVVFVNQTERSEKIVFNGLDEGYSSIAMYQTNASKNLSLVGTFEDLNSELIIGAKTLATCVIR